MDNELVEALVIELREGWAWDEHDLRSRIGSTLYDHDAHDARKGGKCNCKVSAGLASFHADDCPEISDDARKGGGFAQNIIKERDDHAN